MFSKHMLHSADGGEGGEEGVVIPGGSGAIVPPYEIAISLECANARRIVFRQILFDDVPVVHKFKDHRPDLCESNHL